MAEVKDYSGLAATAKRLIEKFGRPATLVKLSRTPTNASQPWRGTTRAADQEVEATVVFGKYEEKDIDGDFIRSGDKKVFIAANSEEVLGEAIEEFDQIKEGDTCWKLVQVQVVEPGDTRLVYIAQARKL